VLANGLVPTYLAVTYSFATGGPEYLLGVANAFETPLAAAFIGGAPYKLNAVDP
jgi:hypothetical protein